LRMATRLPSYAKSAPARSPLAKRASAILLRPTLRSLCRRRFQHPQQRACAGSQRFPHRRQARQGYHPSRPAHCRFIEAYAHVAIKSAPARLTPMEHEYDIPPGDADEMLDLLCKRPIIEKSRYRIVCGDAIWEVDEFLGVIKGSSCRRLSYAPRTRPS
jgi:hypothetical protein